MACMKSLLHVVRCELRYLEDHLHGQGRVVRATEVARIDHLWTPGQRERLGSAESSGCGVS